MTTALVRQVIDALAEFSSGSRLYELSIGDSPGESRPGGLLVEAFYASDGVQEVGYRDVIVLSTSTHLAPDELLGQPATLAVSLADGSRDHFSGEINEVAMLGSDGGLSRYRIRMSPWLWRLEQVRNCRVWQNKSVIEIVDEVFSSYQPAARWRWSEDVGPFMADALPRSYCCQYRESDLDFLRRILAEEGLGWRVEQLEDGVGLVLFADSSQLSAVPEDRSSGAGEGIRFHGARSVEESDSIQAMVAQRRLHASLTTVLSSDYKGKRVIGASSPSHFTADGLPELESFDVPGQYAFADRYQAQRYADLQMQGIEARGQLWQGRSTVRTMRAGTRVRVIDAPLQRLSESASFTVLRVLSIGVNNMPPAAQHALAELFGPIPELLEDGLLIASAPEGLALAIEQARDTGYANCFKALAADLSWRPPLHECDEEAQSRPVAFGTQTAIVVGAEGNDFPNGADEVYCDRLGRIRIRFHWQDSGNAICWVRVAQRSAGAGMGQQFLPRIGQEVLVQFLENDIDRPIVVGALYNGEGEGGIPGTPGGQRKERDSGSCFETAHDQATSAQGNNSGGNSPVWHGASSASTGHHNLTSQYGIRSKERGRLGYCQLAFDDMDGQGRAQLKSTYTGSEVSLGHLIHASDNFRGSFRGIGAELRTDAFGAMRSGKALLVSSYKTDHSTLMRASSVENSPGSALIKQGFALGEFFSRAACTHQTVKFSACIGTSNESLSVLDRSNGPLVAMSNCINSAGGAVGSQTAQPSLLGDQSRVGQGTEMRAEPLIVFSSQSEFGANAGKNAQFTNGESTILMSGKDAQLISGTNMSCWSKQAIGLLGGTINLGISSVGMQLITAKDAIEIQAQAGEGKVIARKELVISTVNAHVDVAARKKVAFTTSGGATIYFQYGNIHINCPGSIKILAGKKKLSGPANIVYALPVLPSSFCHECLKNARDSGSPFILKTV